MSDTTMTEFTLDDIRAAAAKRFASYNLRVNDELVQLRNPMRLSKADRAEFARLQATKGKKAEKDAEGNDIELSTEEAEAIEAGQIDRLKAMLTVVADNRTAVQAVFNEIGDDLALVMELFRAYTEAVKPGEA